MAISSSADVVDSGRISPEIAKAALLSWRDKDRQMVFPGFEEDKASFLDKSSLTPFLRDMQAEEPNKETPPTKKAREEDNGNEDSVMSNFEFITGRVWNRALEALSRHPQESIGKMALWKAVSIRTQAEKDELFRELVHEGCLFVFLDKYVIDRYTTRKLLLNRGIEPPLTSKEIADRLLLGKHYREERERQGPSRRVYACTDPIKIQRRGNGIVPAAILGADSQGGGSVSQTQSQIPSGLVASGDSGTTTTTTMTTTEIWMSADSQKSSI